MRILGSIVAPSTAVMAACEAKIIGCSSIRTQVVGDELFWHSYFFKSLRISFSAARLFRRL
jgi:hypothetical protein